MDNWLPLTTPPQEGERVIVMYESPYSGHREVYTCNYRGGRFIEGGLLLNNLIGWQSAPKFEPA